MLLQSNATVAGGGESLNFNVPNTHQSQAIGG